MRRHWAGISVVIVRDNKKSAMAWQLWHVNTENVGMILTERQFGDFSHQER